MKTQVSILVKNSTLFSRAMTFWWFINIFKKMPVNVWVDEDPEKVKKPTMVLKASKTPYEIDLEPGAHGPVYAQLPVHDDVHCPAVYPHPH